MTSLVDSIKVTPDVTDYNFCNILKGVDNDTKWRHNRKRLQQAGDTILGIYFNHHLVRDKIEQPGYQPAVLKQSIMQYIDRYKPPLPSMNETCIYFRIGDRMLIDFDYISALSQADSVIAIVCNICFSGDNPDDEQWKYSVHKKDQCKHVMGRVINDIRVAYPDKDIKIVSNDEPDLDICYLFKNGFMSHPKCSWKQMFGNF